MDVTNYFLALMQNLGRFLTTYFNTEFVFNGAVVTVAGFVLFCVMVVIVFEFVRS